MKFILLISTLFILSAAYADEAKLLATPSISPVENGLFVKGYGLSSGGKMHAGLLIKGKGSSEVKATADGVVKEAHNGSVEIDHDDSILTRYANLKSISVKNGQKINRGKVVGILGKRPLYYQVLIKGVPVDPALYILKD